MGFESLNFQFWNCFQLTNVTNVCVIDMEVWYSLHMKQLSANIDRFIQLSFSFTMLENSVIDRKTFIMLLNTI